MKNRQIMFIAALLSLLFVVPVHAEGDVTDTENYSSDYRSGNRLSRTLTNFSKYALSAFPFGEVLYEEACKQYFEYYHCFCTVTQMLVAVYRHVSETTEWYQINCGHCMYFPSGSLHWQQKYESCASPESTDVCVPAIDFGGHQIFGECRRLTTVAGP
jgi:hypothetical protein